MSLTIPLLPAERDLLHVLLTSRLGELRQEIHHSMVATFTEQLKQTEEVVKGLLAKIEATHSETKTTSE